MHVTRLFVQITAWVQAPPLAQKPCRTPFSAVRPHRGCLVPTRRDVSVPWGPGAGGRALASRRRCSPAWELPRLSQRGSHSGFAAPRFTSGLQKAGLFIFP